MRILAYKVYRRGKSTGKGEWFFPLFLRGKRGKGQKPVIVEFEAARKVFGNYAVSPPPPPPRGGGGRA